MPVRGNEPLFNHYRQDSFRRITPCKIPCLAFRRRLNSKKPWLKKRTVTNQAPEISARARVVLLGLILDICLYLRGCLLLSLNLDVTMGTTVLFNRCCSERAALSTEFLVFLGEPEVIFIQVLIAAG